MNSKQTLQRMDAALGVAGKTLDGVIAALAHAVSKEGRIDGELSDAYQGEIFQIAQLHSALQAARQACIYGELGNLEARLALAFGGQTLADLRGRLPNLTLHIPNAGAQAADFAVNEEAAALIRETSGETFNSAVWEMLRGAAGDGVDSLGEEHRLLRSTFRAFADKKVAPMAERFHRENLLIPDELIREVSELGCFGAGIPQAYGGFQDRVDHIGVVVVTEELSRGAMIFGSLITRPEILAKALLKGGTAAQKEKFLPAMASGEKMVAISVTEPDYGSDVAGIAITARQDGAGLRMNVAKTFATFAGRAELIGLLTRSEPDPALGHRGLSLFVVEKPPFYGHEFEHVPDGGGRLTGRAIPTAGYRGMHSFELNFEDFFVPAENLVGGEEGRGRGFYLQMEGFTGGRLQTAARALGVMQAAYDQAKSYAKERKIFGRTLGDFALSREKLVRMAATVQAARQSVYATARLMDEGEGQMEASMTKFLLCRQAEWVTREAQQLHGGMGYAEEFPLSRLFIDARVLSIFEGAEEVLALKVIAPALLKRALQ
ncbi:MAG: acyl-CoA/acyl-ACP dehydrogenase [SAR324 cluster bacterium]|nr:acyl-CoA/acyl-ACP dehydrogenase [SAR324 cluster bacterium]